MGYGGLAHFNHCGDIADTKLFRRQYLEHFNAGSVTESLKEFGRLLGLAGRDQFLFSQTDGLRMVA